MDADSWFADLSKQWGGQVETLHGRTAWVHSVKDGGIRSEILLIGPSGTLIRILAEPAVPMDSLRDVANSFEFDTPVPSSG
jgi:hypothetical protein